jgi:hypothetical protein
MVVVYMPIGTAMCFGADGKPGISVSAFPILPQFLNNSVQIAMAPLNASDDISEFLKVQQIKCDNNFGR